MNKIHILSGFFALILAVFPAKCQLPDGTLAPDFTLTDIEGNSHHLYDYLDQGKTVYLDFFACHCPVCWAYHNTGAINSLYNQYGIEGGTNELMVIGIELDRNNGTDEFYGISGITQGNWVAGSSYPLINPEGTVYDQLVADYAAILYPLIYAICPDRTITNLGKKTSEELYQQVDICQALSATTPLIQSDEFLVFQSSSSTLSIKANQNHFYTLKITDLSGRVVQSENNVSNQSEIEIKLGCKGIYFIHLEKDKELVFTQKMYFTIDH